MQMAYAKVLAVLVSTFLSQDAYAMRGRLRQTRSDTVVVKSDHEASGGGAMESYAQAIASRGGRPHMHRATEEASKKMSLDEAVKTLGKDLPAPVATLLRTKSVHEASKQVITEDSRQRGREVLNDLIMENVVQLDNVMADCETFYIRNDASRTVVTQEISDISSQLAMLKERETTAQGIITESEQGLETLNEEFRLAKDTYHETKKGLEFEHFNHASDQAAFSFMMQMTSCGEDDSTPSWFLQTNHTGSGATHSSKGSEHAHFCATRGGKLELRFGDKAMEKKILGHMTLEAQQMLNKLFNRPAGAGGFLQVSKVSSPPEFDARRAGDCVPGVISCGPIHGTLAVEWGKAKDQADLTELTLFRLTEQWTLTEANFNAQIRMLTTQKNTYDSSLAEAISEMNIREQEKSDKTKEKHTLDGDYMHTNKECVKTITDLMDHKICSLKKIRTALLKESTKSPPEDVIDCEVSEWVRPECTKDGELSDCDDTCPDGATGGETIDCGGHIIMTRTEMQRNNSYGVACPVLERAARCNQVKCPIGCSQGDWSDLTTCSKDCGGGVQLQVRQTLVHAKYGGTACEPTQAVYACNVGGCSHDCKLNPWSPWSPCSVACGGGERSMDRSIMTPLVGEGKCAPADDKSRQVWETCNTQRCNDDEVCIAEMDLVIALDASGTMGEDGWEAVKNFSSNMVGRFMGEYYGREDMKVGVLQFGNGFIASGSTEGDNDDDTVSEAIVVHNLTKDISATLPALIEGLAWKRGFSNMAQAIIQADKMLVDEGRPEAASSMLIITNGDAALQFASEQAAIAARATKIQVNVLAIGATAEDTAFLYDKVVSVPKETSYIGLSSFEDIKEPQSETVISKVVAAFCPEAFSPSAQMEKDEEAHMMMIHEWGYPSNECGAWKDLGWVTDINECALLAQQSDYSAFSIGHGEWRHNHCYGEAVVVTDDTWAGWKADLSSPACPQGTWITNVHYNTWAINPNSVLGQ